jgi:hypothetical protein
MPKSNLSWTGGAGDGDPGSVGGPDPWDKTNYFVPPYLSRRQPVGPPNMPSVNPNPVSPPKPGGKHPLNNTFDFSQMFQMPEFNFPEFPDYSELYAQQQAAAERAAGIRDRDTLYREYLGAADDAVSYIDAMIGKEQSTANLMGIDYNITDEERQARISNYFASIWSEGHQSQLEDLMGKYGNPKGFTEFLVQRGDPSQSQDVIEAKSETIATSKGTKPLPMDQIDEDTIGGGKDTNLNLLNL